MYGHLLLGNNSDLYAEWNITEMKVHFKEINKKMANDIKYIRDDGIKTI